MKLTATEMKILIYRKVKAGLAYEEARKEVDRDIKQLAKITKKLKQKKKGLKKDFKKEFGDLKKK